MPPINPGDGLPALFDRPDFGVLSDLQHAAITAFLPNNSKGGGLGILPVDMLADTSFDRRLLVRYG